MRDCISQTGVVLFGVLRQVKTTEYPVEKPQEKFFETTRMAAKKKSKILVGINYLQKIDSLHVPCVWEGVNQDVGV